MAVSSKVNFCEMFRLKYLALPKVWLKHGPTASGRFGNPNSRRDTEHCTKIILKALLFAVLYIKAIYSTKRRKLPCLELLTQPPHLCYTVD